MHFSGHDLKLQYAENTKYILSIILVHLRLFGLKLDNFLLLGRFFHNFIPRSIKFSVEFLCLVSELVKIYYLCRCSTAAHTKHYNFGEICIS